MPSGSIFPRRVVRRAAPFAAAVATAGLLPSVPLAGQRFSAGTELVALQVSVTDEQRRYVSDLTAQDFGVFEDGIPQAVSVFAAAAAPVDVMLLLDSSSSMT